MTDQLSENQKIVSKYDLNQKGEVTLFEGRPFNGVCVSYHHNESKKYEGFYQDGKIVLVKEWNGDGSLKSENKHIDGKREHLNSPFQRESILHNQPLNSSDQGKLLIFSLLMVPSVVFLVGVIPIIFLAFGIYMMKKNQDFSSIDTAVKYFKRYLWLAIIGGVGFSVYWWGQWSHNPYADDKFFISLIALAISIAYLIAVNILFYSPLKEHSEWVAANGIFSTKPKSATKPPIEREVDIIKGEKLKQYSVADELLKWAKLKEEGHISEDEFNEARAKLLKRK